MHTYIFDKYGYLVEDEYTREFSLEKWKFKLEANNKSEKELEELNEFIVRIDEELFRRGVRIIRGKDNRLSQDSEYGQLSLVAVNEFNVSLIDVISLHEHYVSRTLDIKHPNLSSIKELWIKKVDNIRDKILPSLKIDDYLYEIAFSSITYALGLAESAISYLQDTYLDYGDKVKEVTVTHKRLIELNSYELLNPFNIIIDSPMRDISDLYVLDIINKDNVESVLNSYQIDKQMASILLGRILFPSFFFDLLEEGYATKKDVKKEIISYHNLIDRNHQKLVFIHQYLVNRYGIRPINWLSLK